MNVAEEDECN